MKKSEIQVLIVDDDKHIGLTLSEVITRAGFKTTVCARAEDALNQARLKIFQAAIIDCMLPLINGIQLAEELRKSRFGDGMIVLISGIFRDKSFEADSLQKTKAIGFLQKPFGPNDLLKLIKPRLDQLVDQQKWDLQSILTKKMESTRDRLKVVEHLDEIKGMEFAFVLSILADAKVSGFLNLVSEDGNIFGIRLNRGLINGVDSEAADETTVKYLIDTGYLTKEDWAQFEVTEVRKGSPLGKLIQAANVSPHAAHEAQKEQIVQDLKRIMKSAKTNMNFVPEADDANAVGGMDLSELFLELNETFDASLSIDYIKTFFGDKMKSALRKLTTFNQDSPIWKFPTIMRVNGLANLIQPDATLEQLIEKNGNEGDLLKAVYCLIIFRQILFTDPQAAKNFEMEASRRAKILAEIEKRDPYQVFFYFGATQDAKPADVERIYHEFVKTNHPDRLPSDASESLRSITTALFSKVNEAHEILTNPVKLQQFQDAIKAIKAEAELRSENMQRDALELIRRGSYSKAEEKVTELLAIGYTNSAYCLFVWAHLKQTAKPVTKKELADMKSKVEGFSLSERRDPHFHMAHGLIRAGLGDANAIQSFEKALALNPQFVEARREINTQGRTKESISASDILTGDITAIVSQIFKRKSK